MHVINASATFYVLMRIYYFPCWNNKSNTIKYDYFLFALHKFMRPMRTPNYLLKNFEERIDGMLDLMSFAIIISSVLFCFSYQKYLWIMCASSSFKIAPLEKFLYIRRMEEFIGNSVHHAKLIPWYSLNYLKLILFSHFL